MHSIVFSGELVAGFAPGEVKASLAKLFGITEAERLDRLFSGEAVTLGKNLDPARARRYQAMLSDNGALCRIEPPLVQRAEAREDEDRPGAPSAPGADRLSFGTLLVSLNARREAAGGASPGRDTAPTGSGPRSRRLLVPVVVVVVVALAWYSLPVLETIQRTERLEQAERRLDETGDSRARLQQAGKEGRPDDERDARP